MTDNPDIYDRHLKSGEDTKYCVPPLMTAEGYYNNGDNTKMIKKN